MASYLAWVALFYPSDIVVGTCLYLCPVSVEVSPSLRGLVLGAASLVFASLWCLHVLERMNLNQVHLLARGMIVAGLDSSNTWKQCLLVRFV